MFSRFYDATYKIFVTLKKNKNKNNIASLIYVSSTYTERGKKKKWSLSVVIILYSIYPRYNIVIIINNNTILYSHMCVYTIEFIPSSLLSYITILYILCTAVRVFHRLCRTVVKKPWPRSIQKTSVRRSYNYILLLYCIIIIIIIIIMMHHVDCGRPRGYENIDKSRAYPVE